MKIKLHAVLSFLFTIQAFAFEVEQVFLESRQTSDRKIQLPPYVCKLIRSLKQPDTERVVQCFPNEPYYYLRKCCDDLGIQHFRFHTCRAYYVSMCHAIGIPDQYIMANTGHKTDYTLKKIYRRTKSDTQKEMDKKALAQLESFFS